MDRFVGDEVPGLASIPGSRDDQKELAINVWQKYRDRKEACLALATTACIPHQAVVPGTFAAGDFPTFLFSPIGSNNEVVLFVPTEDKPQTVIEGQGRPRTACKAAVPDVDDLATP